MLHHLLLRGNPCPPACVLAHDRMRCTFHSPRVVSLEDRNMDIFGYSPIIAVRISKNILNFWILLDTPPLFLSPYLKFRGGFAPPKTSDSCSEIMGEYPKVSENSKYFWIFSQLWWGNIQKYPYLLSSRVDAIIATVSSKRKPLCLNWSSTKWTKQAFSNYGLFVIILKFLGFSLLLRTGPPTLTECNQEPYPEKYRHSRLFVLGQC